MSTAKTKRIQIKDLKIGDKIKTVKDGEIVFRTVTDKFFSTVHKKDQVQLVFDNSVKLHCSTKHPIMIHSSFCEEQVLPLNLNPSHNVVTDTDNCTIISERIHGEDNDEQYIDITVQDTHTFFASDSENGPMVLTHNSQGGIRNACLEKSTNVKIVQLVQIDGTSFELSDKIIYNSNLITVQDLLNLHGLGEVQAKLEYD